MIPEDTVIVHESDEIDTIQTWFGLIETWRQEQKKKFLK